MVVGASYAAEQKSPRRSSRRSAKHFRTEITGPFASRTTRVAGTLWLLIVFLRPGKVGPVVSTRDDQPRIKDFVSFSEWKSSGQTRSLFFLGNFERSLMMTDSIDVPSHCSCIIITETYSHLWKNTIIDLFFTVLYYNIFYISSYPRTTRRLKCRLLKCIEHWTHRKIRMK